MVFNISYKIFKKWVILNICARNEFQTHNIFPFKSFFDTFIDFILKQKSEESILIATENIENMIGRNKLKDYYWENSEELHNLNEVERFITLYKMTKEFLERVITFRKSKNICDDLYTYLPKFDSNYIEFFNDSDLFD